MAEIKVLKHLQDEYVIAFRVEVTEGDSKTDHLVEVKNDYYRFLTDEKISPGELVKKSFEFLLEREPKESILRRFDLKKISYYFPEFETEIINYF